MSRMLAMLSIMISRTIAKIISIGLVALDEPV